MGPEVGMIVRVKHEEVNPEQEWMIHEIADAVSGGKFYHLKSTGKLVQWLMLPSFVPFELLDNTLPPVLDASKRIKAMPAGDSYHQDRKLVKRIIDGVYNTKLVRPVTDYPLTERAAASWDKSITQERDYALGMFMNDLKIVCGTRPRNLTGAVMDVLTRGTDGFGEDYQSAVEAYKEQAKRKELDTTNWMTFLGIYANYRQIIQS